jgi:hypothetical protein
VRRIERVAARLWRQLPRGAVGRSASGRLAEAWAARGASVVSLPEANESWIFVGSGVPCNEEEMTVSNRHPLLHPFVRYPRVGRVLRSLAPVPQNSTVSFAKNGPRDSLAATSGVQLPAIAITDEYVIHQVVRAGQEGQRGSIPTVRRKRRSNDDRARRRLIKHRALEGREVGRHSRRVDEAVYGQAEVYAQGASCAEREVGE